MAKILTVPVGSPYVPKPSTLGTLSNYNATNRTWEATGINTTMIRNKIGAGSNGIGALSVLSNLINPFALFRPDYASPHNAGEFLGYNHDALPPTYFSGKPTSITVNLTLARKINLSFLLDRGERPPYMDNTDTIWDRVKVAIKKLSGSTYVNIDNYVVAPVYGVSVGNTTPQHLFEITAPSNDYFNFKISVKGYYVTSGYANIKEIEDIYPDVDITVRPYFLYADINTANMFQFGAIRHRYVYQAETTTLAATNVTMFIDNYTSPAFAMVNAAFQSSIIPSVQQNGFTLPYAYTEGLHEGVWTNCGTMLNNTLTAGSEFKDLETGNWYIVSSIQSGYIGIRC